MPDRIDLNDLESFMQSKNKTPNDVELLADTDKIKLLTRLSSGEIRDISTLIYLVEILEMQEIQPLLDNFIQFKVSEGGKGRKEIVDVLKGKGQQMGMFGGFGNGFNK